jgi:DNA-binding response OmpR family regulator
MTRGSDQKRILVIGRSLSLVEGVADLLQMVGYPVDSSAASPETESTTLPAPPDLMIVDLSVAASDVYRRSEQMREAPLWSEVPILYVSFSGDDHIRELQHNSDRNDAHRSRFYAPPVLGLDGLLETVRTCLD